MLAPKDLRHLGGAPRSAAYRATAPLLCAELILASFTVLQGHVIWKDRKELVAIEAQGSAKGAVQLLPVPVLPNSHDALVLIRSTLLSFNDAVQTDNFTVIRDLAAPSFRALDSSELSEMYAGFMACGIDLASVAIMTPTLNTVARAGDNQLRIRGYFADLPAQIAFDLRFESITGQWRLSGISVHPVDDVKAAPPQ